MKNLFTISASISAACILFFALPAQAIEKPGIPLPDKVSIGTKAAKAAVNALTADTTALRLMVMNNTNSPKTFTLGGDRPVTLQPGQSHTYLDPVFKEDARKEFMISSLYCPDTGDKAVLFWEDRRKVKYRFIRFESPGNMTPFYFAAYFDGDYRWQSTGSYQSGRFTTYVTYWLDDSGKALAWGSLMTKGGSAKLQHKEKQPDNRKGIIVYYGGDRALPDASQVVIADGRQDLQSNKTGETNNLKDTTGCTRIALCNYTKDVLTFNFGHDVQGKKMPPYYDFACPERSRGMRAPLSPLSYLRMRASHLRRKTGSLLLPLSNILFP